MEIVLYAEVYLICMVIIGLVLFWSLKSHDRSFTGRWFLSVLICFLVNFTANFAFTLCRAAVPKSPAALTFAFALKTIYHISLIAGVFAWCGYAEAELGTGLFKSKKHIILLTAISLIPVIITFVNIGTRVLFDITESGAYVRGTGFQAEMFILFLLSMIFSVRIFRRIHREPDPIRSSHFRLLGSFPICMAAAWILSFIGESVPVICVSVSVEILCVYIGFSNQRISLDPLTQVNNRQNLIAYIDYKIAHHDDPVYLLIIDVDWFKQINDTYGHLEGDKALIRTAKALKNACGPIEKRPYIARYGGDEFMVIIESASPSLVDTLCAAIKGEAVNLGRVAEAPYEITLSIGVARLEEGMTHNAFIAKADEHLYSIKKAR